MVEPLTHGWRSRARMLEGGTPRAVMQLAETGVVELDAPVQRYIPWLAVADPRRLGRSPSVTC
jgi:hypothetical protein